uniref:Uncharacterized protein n=1 Tax=Sarcophilus harrisii TaxID=9305 RepID=A0A7N4P7U7_SARHA
MKDSAGNWKDLPLSCPSIQIGASKMRVCDFIKRNLQKEWGAIYTQPDFIGLTARINFSIWT